MKIRYYVPSLALVAMLALSCCGQKGATDENLTTNATATTTTMEDTSFDPADYTLGTITETKQEGNCHWIITLPDGRTFETGSMDQKFMKKDAKVYFKYRGLRRMSMCGNTTPVEITEMRMAKG